MRTLLLFAGLFLAVVARAQEAPAVHRLGSVYVGGGGFTSVDPFFGRADIVRFAPASVLLDQDLSDHSFNRESWLTGEGSFDLALGFFPCAGSGRSGPELRLGITYGSGPSFGGSLERTTYTPYDTLISSQTGHQTVVDSVRHSEYRIRYRAERLGVNGSLIWRRPARWTLYGGGGIMAGVLMNAHTTVSFKEEAYVDGSSSFPWNEEYHGSGIAAEERELFRNGSGWWLAAYVPFGIDWKAATVSTFWSRIHFCYELRPQIAVQSIPELPSTTGVGVQAVFLARVEL